MKIIVDGKEMKIEEPDNMFKQIDGKWYARVYNEKTEELQQENKQLKEKIDKAIEYIKDDIDYWKNVSYVELQIEDYIEDRKKLLEILGDKENESN